MRVTRRQLKRPGTAKEGRNTTKQRTTTIKPNDRQSAPLTDEAPEPTAKSIHKSSHTTPTSTATLPAR